MYSENESGVRRRSAKEQMLSSTRIYLYICVYRLTDRQDLVVIVRVYTHCVVYDHDRIPMTLTHTYTYEREDNQFNQFLP